MAFARILRHLAHVPFAVRRAFPELALHAIERAIEEAERGHRGEIVVAVEGALHPLELIAGKQARTRAIEVFAHLRVWDTQRNTGVLVYVLLAERDVEIIADRGIARFVSAEAWRGICQRMEDAFVRGDFEGGTVAAVRAVGELMGRHLAGPDEDDEVPNRPRVV